MNIWYCCSEAVPFCKSGGLADVAGSLSSAWAALGQSVTLVLPLYRQIDRKRFAIEFLTRFSIELGATLYPIEVFALKSSAKTKLRVLFVDLPWAFDRGSMYGYPADYPDNAQRFAVFGRAVAELVSMQGSVEVLVGNDWQCGALMAYLRVLAPKVLRVFCIHNLAYHGDASLNVVPALELEKFSHFFHYEFFGRLSSIKVGISEAALLLTVSPTYARNIQTAEYGCGLDGLLSSRRADLHGIINGIDEQQWQPTSKAVPVPYTAKTIGKKRDNLKRLRRQFKLPDSPGPAFGFVGRLDTQKGIDILVLAFEQWLTQHHGQLLVLGAGHPAYVERLQQLKKKFPKKVGLGLQFDALLAEKIYAGCDYLVMPSRYEPCGLGQLIAYRFGTIPIVRATGGLVDTVQDIDLSEILPKHSGRGIVFAESTLPSLLHALDRAAELYGQAQKLKALQQQLMKLHFTWGQSARAYLELFEERCAA